MDLQSFVDEARWVNSCMAFIAFVWLTVRAWKRRKRYPYSVRLFLSSIQFYLLAVAYSMAEQALQHVEPGFRSLPFLIANSAMLITLAVTQKTHDRFIGPGSED